MCDTEICWNKGITMQYDVAIIGLGAVGYIATQMILQRPLEYDVQIFSLKRFMD
jgi:hypothetical protein